MAEDYIKRIWEILTTFTKEAQNVSLAKCKELNFDPNRGEISFDESLINLNALKLIIMDAIEKKKLIQLPITVQKSILSNLESITKSLTGLANGTDEVLNLVNAIEKLNTAIWQYGFHNLSEEVLGYQEKLNQLKNLDLEIKRLQKELESGLDLKSELAQLLHEAKMATETIQAKVTTAEENAKNTTEKTNLTLELSIKSTETLSSIQQTEKEAKESASAVATLKEKVDNWSKGIKELSETSEKISKNITDQENELNRLIQLTEKTHKQVESLLPGAASAGLASAFKQRKDEIVKTKKYWVGGFVLSLLGLLGMVVWMIRIFSELGGNIEWWMFFLQRAPLLFPLIWLGWFFGRNYGHMVRLEEDYAFKESISMSFEGYKNQMKEVDPLNALPQLCGNTISILSETPLRVFDRKTADETPANSFLERFMPKGKETKKE